MIDQFFGRDKKIKHFIETEGYLLRYFGTNY